MRLRPRRRNLVVWSSAGAPGGGSWAWRPARPRRIRWWCRTVTLLALIGVVRLARAARAHWEAVCLGTGATLMLIGFTWPSAFVAFLLGMLMLVVTLLKGVANKGRAADQAADCWQWRG